MKQEIILLYASSYMMTDEKTGEIKRGVTCNYYFNTNLDCIDNENGSVGTRPAKGSMPVELMRKIPKAPALYNAEFEMSVGSDGKPVLKICNLDYISPVVIDRLPDKPEAGQEPKKSDAPSKAS